MKKYYYALSLEYLGTNYHGWQRQKNKKTIQSELENALSIIANTKINVVCAGRTDQGVHATAQIVNFQTCARREINAWVRGANSYLPEDIKISHIYKVNKNFNARFSAIYRRYQYIIYNSKTKSALNSNRMLWIPQKINIQKMNEACKYLIGEQNFSSFQSSKCQSSHAQRYIYHAYFKKYDKFIIFDIKSNAFLHQMIRIILGSIFNIGYEKKSIEWIKELIKVKNRQNSGPTIPPHGLHLIEVGYHNHDNIKVCKEVKFI